MTRKTAEEITVEIAKLKEIKPNVLQRSKFGDNHHDAIDAQIEVLERNLSIDTICDNHDSAVDGDMDDDLWYADNVYDNAIEAANWRDGEEGLNPPSEDWKSLVL